MLPADRTTWTRSVEYQLGVLLPGRVVGLPSDDALDAAVDPDPVGDVNDLLDRVTFEKSTGTASYRSASASRSGSLSTTNTRLPQPRVVAGDAERVEVGGRDDLRGVAAAPAGLRDPVPLPREILGWRRHGPGPRRGQAIERLVDLIVPRTTRTRVVQDCDDERRVQRAVLLGLRIEGSGQTGVLVDPTGSL